MLLRVLRSLLKRGGEKRPARHRPDKVFAAPVSAARTPGIGASMPEQLRKLAAFAGGREVAAGAMPTIVSPASSSAAGAAGRPNSIVNDVREVVAHASGLIAETLCPETRARIDAYTALFSAAAVPGKGLNVFAFHADLADASEVRYVDIHLKVGDFDYFDILQHFVARIRQHCGGATVYLVTTPGARYRQLAAPDVRVVELPLNAAQPMYERANALLAYASSAAFTENTVFLDSDALVNRPLDEVFALGFDVGLTYRTTPGLMPVNEGAIYFGAARPAAVREFLRRRLATYDRLVSDALVTRFYGDVRRWRGGQLSLNAVSHGLAPYSPYRVQEVEGARLRMLPCDTYNFSAGDETALALDHLEDRYVIHFKGALKYAFRLAAGTVRPMSAKA